MVRIDLFESPKMPSQGPPPPPPPPLPTAAVLDALSRGSSKHHRDSRAESVENIDAGTTGDICGDGSVLKVILQSGTGQRTPSNGDVVQCFYNGRVETDRLDDDEFVLSQDLLGDISEFTVGSPKNIEGLNDGLLTMRRNEIATFTIAASKAYGVTGSQMMSPSCSMKLNIHLLDFAAPAEYNQTHSTPKPSAPHRLTTIVTAGILAFPGQTVRFDCQEQPAGLLKLIQEAYNNKSRLGLVGLRSITSETVAPNALIGVIGAEVTVTSITSLDNGRILSASFKGINRILIQHAISLPLSFTEHRARKSTRQSITMAAIVSVRFRWIEDDDVTCHWLYPSDHCCQYALDSWEKFLHYAKPSPAWQILALDLGDLPQPPTTNDMNKYAAYMQNLSFYMAAAVPTRFGHSGRHKLLATVSARDRLRAVGMIYETHPPVSRSLVRELETMPRIRHDTNILQSPGNLVSLCIDAIVLKLVDGRFAEVQNLKYFPHLVTAVSDRAVALSVLNPKICTFLGEYGTKRISVEQVQGPDTTKNWIGAILKCEQLTCLELVGMSNLQNDTIRPCVEALSARLIRLSLEKCSSISGAALTSLKNSKSLRSLNISGTSLFAEEFITIVATLGFLLELNVSCTKFSVNEALIVLKQLTQLQRFECSATKLSEGSSTKELRTTGQNIGYVNLRFSEFLYNIEWIRGWSKLTSVDLSLCPRLEDDAMHSLTQLPLLTKVNISKTMVTNRGFAVLASIKKLTHIDAEGLSLTDSIGSSLQHLEQLEHLSLMFTLGISDAIVSSLPLQCLHTLKLPYKPTGSALVTDSALQTLALLEPTKLKVLTCGGSGITDSAAKWIVMLPHCLGKICLWHTRVTVQGQEDISGGTGLSVDDSMRTSKGTYILIP